MSHARRPSKSLGLFLFFAALPGVAGGGAGAAVIPETDLVPTVWLRADAINGIDGSGNPEDGQSVLRWADFSENARDAIQTNATRQPTFRAGVVNSLPAVRFNLNTGTPDEFMSITGAPIGNRDDSDVTMFFVAKNNSLADTNREIVVNTRPNGTTGNGFGFGYGSPTQTFYFHTGASPNATDVLADQFNVVAVRRDGSGNPEDPADDNQLIELSQNGSPAVRYTLNGFNPSTLTSTQLGTEGGSHYFEGDLAEVVIFESLLGDAEKAQVERYLAGKYGIAVVPEPASAAVLALCGVKLLRRRRA